jgi:hypothetical protein
MQPFLITLAIVAMIVLIHWSYVDFRFRYREGMAWFWLLNPAPAMMWIGRATAVAAVLAALATAVVGINAILAWAIAGLVVAHIISLILLEVLEPR